MTDRQLVVRRVLASAGVIPTPSARLEDYRIDRSSLLASGVLTDLRDGIDAHRSLFSSSTLSFLHTTADARQRWPGLNGVRQLLSSIGYSMVPRRTAAGYDSRKRKKYRRHFVLKPKHVVPPTQPCPAHIAARTFVENAIKSAVERVIDYRQRNMQGVGDGAPRSPPGPG